MLRDLPAPDRGLSHDETVFMSSLSSDHNEQEIYHNENVDPLDDVFGSAPSSPSFEAANADLRRGVERTEYSDIPRLRSIHVTNGYREGIAASKEQHIQAGFDEGYGLGGEIGTQVGWCLGVLEGICTAARKTRQGTGEDMQASFTYSMTDLYTEAQEQLKMEKLLSPKYFGPDGLWLYNVSGQDAGEAELCVTFRNVADAHPVLMKWKGRIQQLSAEIRLRITLK